MYYCAVHQIAYEQPLQFGGHWLHVHQGEPRPKSEEVFVEEVPEGTEIAGPPKARRPRRAPTIRPRAGSPRACRRGS